MLPAYQPRSIPRLILEKNLFGLDIDDRAAQLAAFALLMKARVDDRRLFNEPPKLNVLSLQESRGLSIDDLSSNLAAFGMQRATIKTLLDTFEHAKTFGSLTQIPESLAGRLTAMTTALDRALVEGDLYAQQAAKDVLPLMWQALMLQTHFDAVVANPPYMGSKYLEPTLKALLRDGYLGFDKDLFSAFAVRCAQLARRHSEVAMMSSNVWMFLSSYEEMRRWLIDKKSLSSLIQLSNSGFDGATVFVCAYSFTNAIVEGKVGSYIRLTDFSRPADQSPMALAAISDRDCSYRYKLAASEFNDVPGAPIAYWASKRVREVFKRGRSLAAVSEPRLGMATGNNDLRLRLWHEVSIARVGLGIASRLEAKRSGCKWFPYNKGGNFRRWFGNCEYLVDWENDGHALQTTLHPSGKRVWAHNFNLDFIFQSGITWTATSSSYFAVRQSDAGFLFDVKGSTCFPQVGYEATVLGYLSSSLTQHFMTFLNPSVEFQPGNIASLPLWDAPLRERKDEIATTVAGCVDIARFDWNSFEHSWNFEGLRWKDAGPSLELSWAAWNKQTANRIATMQALEQQNNKNFIEAYGLDGEVEETVLLEHITLIRTSRERDSQRLISYSIGCIMGRYSLDQPGLIYAHAGNMGFDPTRYQEKLPADADGILPLTGERWFGDDAASRVREFLVAVWGVETLDENMTWLGESLGTKGSETPDETVRRYLADKFFKDHLQTYKKRPIYWLFSSGKQGAFQALVYLHRYNEGTLARMRAEYVVPLIAKMVSRLDMLNQDVASASSAAARTKLQKQIETLRKKQIELLAYDEKLRHYADMRITLDLDDGVKVNYAKFGDLVAESKAITGGSDD